MRRLKTAAALAVFTVRIANGQAFAETLNTEIGGPMALLRDGRVLFPGDGLSQTAVLFNPSDQSLTAAGILNRPRFGYSTALLPDGRVLIAGGFTTSTQITGATRAEIYDPAKGAFELTGSLPAGYTMAMAMAPLPDGRVLVVGADWSTGKQIMPVFDPSAIYDPTTGTFSAVNPIPMLYPVATRLADGRILFVGVAADWSQNIALIYDPATGAFKPTGSPSPYSIFPEGQECGGEIGLATFLFSTTLLADGNVLLVGGWDMDYPDVLEYRNTAEIYDPLTGSFHQTSSLPVAMQSPGATTLPSGQVLAGGNKGAALYDPATGVFSPLPSPVPSGSGVVLPDGTVLMDTAYVFVPAPALLSSASLKGTLAPESLASFFGAHLAPTTASATDAQSPPTSLGGITVMVRDSIGTLRTAPVLYVSPSQINFEVPAGVVSGNMTILAQTASGGVGASAPVNTVAPGLFALPQSTSAAAYATRIEPDGSQTILAPGAPIALDARPVYLSLFGTGIRGLSSLNNLVVTIGGVNTQVTYAGPQGSIPGLDQVNLMIPAALKSAGVVPLQLTVDGAAANQVVVDIL